MTAPGSGIHKYELQAQRARCCLQVHDDGSVVCRGRVHENAKNGSIGYQLAEQLQLFRHQLDRQTCSTGDVAAGPIEAGDKTQCDRVGVCDKDDGYRCCPYFRRQRRGCAAGRDNRNAASNEIGCKRR